MNVETCAAWNETFFQNFVSLRNRLRAGDPNDIPESISDLKGMFGSGAPFQQHNSWEAALLSDEDGNAVGRILVGRPHDWPEDKFLPVGYFECENNSEAAEALFQWTEARILSWGYREARGPIQGTFFNSYRYRVPGGEAMFHGEPLCPEYYHELFAANGYDVSGRWTSVVNSTQMDLENSGQIMKKMMDAHRAAGIQIVVRDLRLDRWEEELTLFHKLFTESFASMPDFMPISLEEFMHFYDDFKYVVSKDLSFVLEVDGEPQGFMIAHFDPQEILLKANKSIWPWRKLLALFKLKKNRKRLLIPYVGKIKGKKEIKGVIGIVGFELLKRAQKYVDEFVICYIADGSPTLANIAGSIRTHGQYVLYSKKFV